MQSHMRIIAVSFFLALISFTMACPTSKPVAPGNDASDGASLDGVHITTSSCHDAWLKLQFFNCPEGDPRDAGDNFEQVCAHGQSSHAFDMHPECINKAKNQDEIRSLCNVKCQR